METSRFVEITDEELIEFVEEQENPNTKRKMRTTSSYSKVSYRRQILAYLVQHLFMSFRRKF